MCQMSIKISQKYKRELNLKLLNINETCDLIRKTSLNNCYVEEGCTELAFKFTKGHPYRLHYYLNAVLL